MEFVPDVILYGKIEASKFSKITCRYKRPKDTSKDFVYRLVSDINQINEELLNVILNSMKYLLNDRRSKREVIEIIMYFTIILKLINDVGEIFDLLYPDHFELR